MGAAEGEVAVGEEVAINIRCSNGSKFTVRTSLNSTVSAFKLLVAQNCDIPAQHQRLIYKGRILMDDETLHSYGLQVDHTVHMVHSLAPSQTTTLSATTSSGTTDASPAAASAAVPTENVGLGSASLGASLFPGLGFSGLGGTGGSALLGAGLPDFEQMQQQLTQNPNIMRDIMNMPAM